MLGIFGLGGVEFLILLLLLGCAAVTGTIFLVMYLLKPKKSRED